MGWCHNLAPHQKIKLGHAYTPGLKVTDQLVITKKRILPLKGEVLVKVGEAVGPDAVVARTHLPGPVEPENVANILGVAPADVPRVSVALASPVVSVETVVSETPAKFPPPLVTLKVTE